LAQGVSSCWVMLARCLPPVQVRWCMCGSWGPLWPL
jgi:hypothetical protein